jgi:Na+-driven multidrug efflux pump
MDVRTKRILNIAIPTLLDALMLWLVSFVDTLFIAKISLDATAGVSLASNFTNIYFAFFIAIDVGAASLVAQTIGARDLQKEKD